MKAALVKSFLLVSVFVGGLALAPVASAANPLEDVCDGVTDSAICNDSANNNTTPESVVAVVVNTLLYIVGFLSVIMIIVGGLRYVTSAGNASAVTGAKNTLVYAIVGLVVSFMAYAIVNWVLDVF